MVDPSPGLPQALLLCAGSLSPSASFVKVPAKGQRRHGGEAAGCWWPGCFSVQLLERKPLLEGGGKYSNIIPTGKWITRSTPPVRMESLKVRRQAFTFTMVSRC